MNEDTRSIAERTTRSEYFDWTEWVGGGHWSGKRNARTIFEITLIEDGRYVLESSITGTTKMLPSGPLTAVQAKADKVFEDWTHSLGLKIDEEWWKENRG